MADTNETDVLHFFRHHHIYLKACWLNQALNFVLRYLPSASRTAVLAQVFRQWKYSDLKSTSEYINDQSNRPFILQVKSILDVASPLYGRHANATPYLDGCEVNKELLLLDLSDTSGESLKAVVKQPIYKLSLSTPPGCKMLVHGDIKFIRQILMLTNENCQILGGSVLEHSQSNQLPANSLAPSPQLRKDPLPLAPPLSKKDPPKHTPPQQPKKYIPEQAPSPQLRKDPLPLAPPLSKKDPPKYTPPQQPNKYIPEQPSSPQLRKDPLEQIAPPLSKTDPPESDPLVQRYVQLGLSLSLLDISRKTAFGVGIQRFKTHAFVLEVISPLRIVDSEWSMTVILIDDSNKRIECSIAHTLLCELIGINPVEAIAIKNHGSMEKRREGTDRIRFLDIQLLRLDLIFDVEFFSRVKATVKGLKTLSQQLDLF